MVNNLNVSSAPIEIPLLFLILNSKFAVLITSDLRNLPASTSTPDIDKACAFLAVPFSTGKNPPTKLAISPEVAGALILMPALIRLNPKLENLIMLIIFLNGIKWLMI